ncbi:MAG: DUF2202 domain-containing protein [Fimbriimonadaceae bacterium]
MSILAWTAAALALLGPATKDDVRALRLALADERAAIALYEAAIGALGPHPPFSNLVRAERNHAALVEATMRKLDVPVPDGLPKPAEPPASRKDALEAAIRAERENVALYDRLLRLDLSLEVRRTLETLQSASRDRHLPALERALGRAGGGDGGGQLRSGPGQGQRGWRWRHGRAGR